MGKVGGFELYCQTASAVQFFVGYACSLQPRNYRTEGYKTDNGNGNSKDTQTTSQPGAPHKERPAAQSMF